MLIDNTPDTLKHHVFLTIDTYNYCNNLLNYYYISIEVPTFVFCKINLIFRYNGPIVVSH